MTLFSLPKFIWKHIIDNLSPNDIVNMRLVLKYFDNTVDEANWKRCFDNGSCAIALVKCTKNDMDNFWYYACFNHDACGSIDNALNKIENNIYNKIFIKHGTYQINAVNVEHNYIWHSYWRICSVELIGSSSAITTIIGKHSNFSNYLINGLRTLFISNITFGVDLNVRNAYELFITDCKFGQSMLRLNNVIKVTVECCIFNGAAPIHVNMGYGNEPKIEYIINNNIFKRNYIREGEICIFFSNNVDMTSSIDISNNIISNYGMLCQIGEYIIITFRNNHISNIHSCILCWWINNNSDIVFNNNTFDHVERLYGDNNVTDKMTLETNNTYIDCGHELMRYTK